MAADLEAIGAETILYAPPDGALRYVPLAALQDGTRVKIILTSTGEVLAYLDNVNFNLIDPTDFVSV